MDRLYSVHLYFRIGFSLFVILDDRLVGIGTQLNHLPDLLPSFRLSLEIHFNMGLAPAKRSSDLFHEK